MATIAAVELGVRAGKPALLATLGSPMPGNRAFAELQNRAVRPAGGLRIHNQGDLVPLLGWFGVSAVSFVAHGGREVSLPKPFFHRWNSWKAHQHYTIPSSCATESGDDGPALVCLPGRSSALASGGTCRAKPKMVTFTFPGLGYRPTAAAASSLGQHFSRGNVDTLLCHESCLGTKSTASTGAFCQSTGEPRAADKPFVNGAGPPSLLPLAASR